MARTPEQIEKDLAESINTSDPTWDTTQGPIKELFTVPMSGVIAESETIAENLRQLFSLNFENVATEEEVRQALNNFGSTPGIGTRSTHTQYFIRFTRPREDVTIPVGTLVSNSTGVLIYRTTQSVTMLSTQADSYYNPTRRVYEIPVPVEAEGVGPEYELPAFRVNTLLTPINGIDSTENRIKSSKGLSSETTNQQAERLKTALLGLNINTQGGIRKKILDVFPNQVQLVEVITPSDPEFQRVLYRPSIDIYVLGEVTETQIETITAIPGQTEIVPNFQPVNSVESVVVNNTTPVGFTLVKDESNETRSSSSSTDYILLDTPLSNGDQVTYQYTYNSLLSQIKELVFNDSADSIFRVDYLIRTFQYVTPLITFDVKVLSSYSFEEVSLNIRSRLSEILNSTIKKDRLSANEVREDIISNVSGIQNLRVGRFRRDFNSFSNVELIVLRLNEITRYNESSVEIRAIR